MAYEVPRRVIFSQLFATSAVLNPHIFVKALLSPKTTHELPHV
jgi:hypothetical protein